jgi:thymidylate synthase
LFRVFNSRTADGAWRDVICAINAGEGVSEQPSRSGPTREILHVGISLSDPRQKWVASRNPPINLAFALAEVVWIMAGRDDAAFLNYFNRGLPKYCGAGPTYHGAYGHRLRKRLGIDQLERAYETLSKNPLSRQVVLQIWDGTVDLPTPDGKPSAEDVPCNISAMLKIRDGALEWTQTMRSNDVFRGLPYNLVQFTSMQEIVAGWLNLKVGSYNHLSDSLHLYDSDLGEMGALEPVLVVENQDSLSLSKSDFELAFGELERQTNAITHENVTSNTLVEIVRQSCLPVPYRNILCVLCAEGARKRKSNNCIDEIMENCTNGAYQQLFAQWLSRFRVVERV